jgi:hypothetical protein
MWLSFLSELQGVADSFTGLGEAALSKAKAREILGEASPKVAIARA